MKLTADAPQVDIYRNDLSGPIIKEVTCLAGYDPDRHEVHLIAADGESLVLDATGFIWVAEWLAKMTGDDPIRPTPA